MLISLDNDKPTKTTKKASSSLSQTLFIDILSLRDEKVKVRQQT
jgi:hypothetical protein